MDCKPSLATTPSRWIFIISLCSTACGPVPEPAASCTVTTDDDGIAFIRCPDGSENLLGPVASDTDERPPQEQEEEPAVDSGSASTQDPSVLIGTLIIENALDLQEASAYEVITQNLLIRDTTVTSLEGLQNLRFVGGEVSIVRNPVLTSLSSLRNLASVGRDLDINDNDSLTDMQGLENLTTVGEDFVINGNPNLTSLEGLNGLTTSDTLRIQENDQLDSLQGLENLTSLSVLTLRDNPSLSTLDGLDSIATLDSLQIFGSSSLCPTIVSLFQAQLAITQSIINLEESTCIEASQ